MIAALHFRGASEAGGIMKEKMIKGVSYIIVALVGILVGFFVAFNIVYSDVVGLLDRFGSLAYVFLAYIVCGSVFEFARPDLGLSGVLWLTAPGISMLVAYSFREPQQITLHILVAAIAVFSATLGAVLVQSMRSRRQNKERARARERANQRFPGYVPSHDRRLQS